jgi:hypothetical protein
VGGRFGAVEDLEVNGRSGRARDIRTCAQC